jgi:Skp family chaperone for outer membrane proteins
MEIYLNTRSFEQDYQWFSINSDNTISISQNFWDMKEISKLPISDEFSLVLGKLESEELFLLASDLESNRFDFKERTIHNSLLFISDDEVILRKLATLFMFNHGDLNYDLNSVIVDFQEGAYGFSTEHSQILEVIHKYLDYYEVKFEFDAITESSFSRFGELFLKKSVTDDMGEDKIEYHLNPVFENKTKRFLLGEMFPDDRTVLFLYSPLLSLHDIERSSVHLAVTKNLDKFAKDLFLQDTEEWAMIEESGPRFSGVLGVLSKNREWFAILAIGVILIPLILSYSNMSSENRELVELTHNLQNEKRVLEVEKQNAVEQSLQYENRITELEKELEKVQHEVEAKNSALTSLEKKIQKELRRGDTQKLGDEILTLKNSLGACEDKFEREATQRQKLAKGYLWYKGLYNKCKAGE